MKLETLSANEQIEAFNAACIGQWAEIFNGTLKGSNASVRKMDRLAASWADRGVLREMLGEHLLQGDERLRFAAAANLGSTSATRLPSPRCETSWALLRRWSAFLLLPSFEPTALSDRAERRASASFEAFGSARAKSATGRQRYD